MKRPMLLHTIEKVHLTENGFMSSDLNSLSRMVVPGGWVYFNNTRTEFVPDKEIEIFSSKADMEIYISDQRAQHEAASLLAPIPMNTSAPIPRKLAKDFDLPRWWQFWK